MIAAILRAKLPLNEANIDDGAGFAAKPLAIPRCCRPAQFVCFLLLRQFAVALSPNSFLRRLNKRISHFFIQLNKVNQP